MLYAYIRRSTVIPFHCWPALFWSSVVPKYFMERVGEKRLGTVTALFVVLQNYETPLALIYRYNFYKPT